VLEGKPWDFPKNSSADCSEVVVKDFFAQGTLVKKRFSMGVDKL